MAADEEHEGASIKEILIEACRTNNTELLLDQLEDKGDDEISRLLNDTTTVLGNHLYHEAASRGHYEIIDLLLDQPNFECDPLTRADRDTPLHTAIRWLNSEPPEQRPFGLALITMMLEAGSSPRTKNKAGLKPIQLVDPRNEELRDLLDKFEYAELNAGDFVAVGSGEGAVNGLADGNKATTAVQHEEEDDDDIDEDAEFSGSDEEERAEWERRRKEKKR